METCCLTRIFGLASRYHCQSRKAVALEVRGKPELGRRDGNIMPSVRGKLSSGRARTTQRKGYFEMETKFDVVVEDSVVKVLPSPSGDGLTDALVDAAIAAHNNETAVEVFDLILTPMDIFGLLSNVVRAMIAEEDWLEGTDDWEEDLEPGDTDGDL